MKKTHTMMRENLPKDPEYRDQTMTKNHTKKTLRKCMCIILFFILFISLTYTIIFTYSSQPNPCNLDHHHPTIITHHQQQQHKLEALSPLRLQNQTQNKAKTSLQLHHIVFGIGASAKLWDHRKNYIKQWWRPNEMRGYVWLDKLPVIKNNETDKESLFLPPLKLSSNTLKFKYKHKAGHRSAIRISRIVSEMLRLVSIGSEKEEVRWFVMGDDDTFFVGDNLVRVLDKYDHKEFYYIGSTSESHLQNMHFSNNMAYGGGGFAISYALAIALEKMQDKCIQRYPQLYGSDDRLHACMSELGVPLTKEPGFHQFDVYGNLFGLLAAHPIAPLVSLHHLDVVEPIFPHVNRVQALERLKVPIQMDSAGLMQQSICYDKTRLWTVSVSWGYAVQIFRGIMLPREMEVPSRTFLNWYRRADYTGFAFNSRPVTRNVCQAPFVYYLSNMIVYDNHKNQSASEYLQFRLPYPKCKWKIKDPFKMIRRIEVHKRLDPYLWDKPPRRNCCRILPTKSKGTMVINVGVCREGETIGLR